MDSLRKKNALIFISLFSGKLSFFFQAALTCVCILIISSCTNNTIASTLGYSCVSEKGFTNLKSLTDVKNNFEIKIPEHWKKEFFVDNSESRLYCADTTKELNSTYIFDLGHYSGKLKIDTAFIKKAKKAISKNGSELILKSKKITFQNKPGYCFVSKSTSEKFEYQTLHAYISNKNNTYYLLKIDVYGTTHIEERFCEALSLFKNTQMH